MRSDAHDELAKYLRKMAQRPGMFAPSEELELAAFLGGVLYWHKVLHPFDERKLYDLLIPHTKLTDQVHWIGQIHGAMVAMGGSSAIEMMAGLFESLAEEGGAEKRI